MSITLNETFRVSAAPDRVWEFLKDPAQVVTCLPGAELTETIDAKTYAGRVKVKVGPISAAYSGRAILAEVDDAARRMQIVAQGKESGGSGQARMTMTGQVSALAEGGSEVSVDAQIDIAGRVMQFGRTLIESVNKQLFKQFADSVQAKLSVGEPEGAAASAPLPVPDEPPPPPFLHPPDAPLPPTPPPMVPTPRMPSMPAPKISVASARAPAALAKGNELRIIPLLWNVLIDFLKGIAGRNR
ncbi:MAG: SRPBCC family protein [Gemmatimonadaceae bacterium]